jgi:5-methylcytosine-specific restriction endonuclease McrA
MSARGIISARALPRDAVRAFRERLLPRIIAGSNQGWRKVIKRDPCPYCCLTPRADFGKTRMTIEHIVPLALGGGDTWRNIVGAHEGCNHQRGQRPLLHFLVFRQVSAGKSKLERRQLRRAFFRGSAQETAEPRTSLRGSSNR